MELFLLLSIGMSIVAFISLALNQAPTPISIPDRNFETTFPLDAQLLASNQINILKMEEQIIAIGNSIESVDPLVESLEESQELLAVSEL